MDINPIELQSYLKGATYPARREDLASLAESNDAPGEIVEAIRGMDADEVSGPDQVMKHAA
jgi:hypothetical protein